MKSEKKTGGKLIRVKVFGYIIFINKLYTIIDNNIFKNKKIIIIL